MANMASMVRVWVLTYPVVRQLLGEKRSREEALRRCFYFDDVTNMSSIDMCIYVYNRPLKLSAWSVFVHQISNLFFPVFAMLQLKGLQELGLQLFHLFRLLRRAGRHSVPTGPVLTPVEEVCPPRSTSYRCLALRRP